MLEVSDAFVELGKDFSLPEREFRIFCFIIKSDNHVLNLEETTEEKC